MSDSGVIYISELIFNILNVSTLKSVITGDIYKESDEINNTNENVIILTNGLTSSYKTHVQIGLANVNIKIPANTNGTPKLTRFKTIADIIRNLLTENNRNDKNGFYFDISLETLFKEKEQNQNYYYNFKLNIQKQ
jgi:hypothetical protein